MCRFRLVADPSLRGDVSERQSKSSGTPTRRVETTVLRVVRDTKLGKQVKRLYDYRCQVCGTRLECEGGPYADGQEFRFFQALEKARSFEFDQGLLFLLDNDGAQVLRLSRKS